MILIPMERLAPDILEAIIEEYIGREGTDYGFQEATVDTKIRQVREQLRRGDVVVAYDPGLQSCNLLVKREWERLSREVQLAQDSASLASDQTDPSN